MYKPESEQIELLRGGSIVSTLVGAFGSAVRETRLTALLGYLIALESEHFLTLFGFKGNLYGKDVEVYFVKRMRDERKFPTRQALVNQIAKDMDKAHKILYKKS